MRALTCPPARSSGINPHSNRHGSLASSLTVIWYKHIFGRGRYLEHDGAVAARPAVPRPVSALAWPITESTSDNRLMLRMHETDPEFQRFLGSDAFFGPLAAAHRETTAAASTGQQQISPQLSPSSMAPELPPRYRIQLQYQRDCGHGTAPAGKEPLCTYDTTIDIDLTNSSLSSRGTTPWCVSLALSVCRYIAFSLTVQPHCVSVSHCSSLSVICSYTTDTSSRLRGYANLKTINRSTHIFDYGVSCSRELKLQAVTRSLSLSLSLARVRAPLFSFL